jgi:hypothetical protein
VTTGIVSPNLPINTSWRSTLANAFQTLRRIAFLTEQVFQWGDFDPQIDWQGMAASTVLINRSRYLKIWRFFWFSVDFQATLAAPFTNYITIQIPSTVAPDSPTTFQAGGTMIQNAGALEAGFWFATSSQNTLKFERTASGNFTAGAARIWGNGFIEVNLNG